MNLFSPGPDIVRKIIDYLNPQECHMVRRTCRELSTYVMADKPFTAKIFLKMALAEQRQVRKIINIKNIKQLKMITAINPKISHLHFANSFNQKLKDLLPVDLTHLSFGDDYNKILPPLPRGLLQLIFGVSYNQCFIYVLPKTLKQLKFGYRFDNYIIGPLPNGLTHLTLSANYTKRLPRLPKSLDHLKYVLFE